MPGQHADFYSAPLTERGRRGRRADGAAPGRVADRRGGAVRQALRRRPGRRGRRCRTGWSRRSGSPACRPTIGRRDTGDGDAARRSSTGSRPGTGCGSRSPPPTRRYATPAAADRLHGGRRTGAVTLPDRRRHADRQPRTLIWRYVLAGLLVAASRSGSSSRRAVGPPPAPRAGTARCDPEYADTPLVVRGLRKEYADGFVAVSQVDFTVRPRPGGRPARAERRRQDHHAAGADGPDPADRRARSTSSATGWCPARRCCPGSARWSRGPASCRTCPAWTTCRLYWRATGRPAADAHFDEALEIAGLGDAIHRQVKNYSHGMRQRLAIAQAMLGLPELLVLDEPTDGLDPPQIAEMRRVLQRYATDGRAVLVSSHLLAEVEQTCTARGGDAQGRDRGVRARSTRSSATRRRVQFDVSDVRPRRGRCSTGCRRPLGAAGRATAAWSSTSTARPAAEVVAALVRPASGWTGWCPGAGWRTRSWPWSAATPRKR